MDTTRGSAVDQLNRVDVISSRLSNAYTLCTKCDSPTRDGRCWICGNGVANTATPRSPLGLLVRVIWALALGPYEAVLVHKATCPEQNTVGGCTDPWWYTVLGFMVRSTILAALMLQQGRSAVWHFPHPLVIAILTGWLFHPFIWLYLLVNFLVGTWQWLKYKLSRLTRAIKH